MTGFDLSNLSPTGLDQAQNPKDYAAVWKPTSAGDIALKADLVRQRRNADKAFFADFMESAKYDPEKAAEVRKLSIEIGGRLDEQTITDNLDKARQIEQGLRVKRMDLARRSPLLRMQLENPDFRKIAWDQTEELGTLEGLFNNVRVGWLENEVGKLGSAAVGRELTAMEAQRIAKLRGRIAALRNDDIPFLSPAARITGQLAEGVPTIVGGAAAGAAVGSVVPGIGTVTGAGYGAFAGLAIDSYRVNSGQLYVQMLDQNYSIESATRSAVASGVANAALEVLGGKIVTSTARRFVKDKLLERAGQMALRPITTGSTLRRRLTQYATAVGGETSTEIGQEIVNIAAEEFARRDESNAKRVHPETGEPLSSTYSRGESIDVLVDTAIEVAQGMMVLGLGSPSFGALGDRRSIEEVQSTQDFLTDLQKGIDGQKVGARSPDQFEQFLNQLADGTPAERVHIDSREMERILTEGGVTPDQLRSRFPDIAEQIENAKKFPDLAMDVVIPIEKFSADIVPLKALFEEMKPHVRLDGDQMSLAELERDQEVVVEEVVRSQAAIDKTMESREVAVNESYEVGDELTQQLVGAGVTHREARESVLPMRSFIEVRARQSGMSPREFFETYKPTIQRRLGDPIAGDIAATDESGEQRGTFGRKSRTINLHKKADPTTFLHESSHYFVDVTIDMIRSQASGQKLGSRQLDEDANEMMDWFEIGDASMPTKDRIVMWDALDDATQGKKHESFAYNWEVYLSEGKAPTPKLKRLFSKISAWMRALYGDIRDRLNGIYKREFGEDLPALTPEIRGVMDRMLDAQGTIETAGQMRAGLPQFESAEEAGMTEEQWAHHQDERAREGSEAIDALTAQLMADSRWAGRVKIGREREINAKAKARRREIATEERDQANKVRVNRLRRYLRKGERTNEEGEEVGVDAIHKLNTAAVRTLLPGVDLRTLGSITSPEGVDPGQVAGAFGYDGALQMLEELRGAQGLESSIRERTSQRMQQEHGDLANPEAIKASVLHALYNESRMRAISQQIRVVEGLATPTRPQLEAARQIATRRIEQTAIRDVRPDRYEQQAVRARRAAFRALRSDDRRAAADAFRTELVFSMMVREAAKAKLEINKATRRVSNYFASDKRVAKGRDMSYVYVARAVLSWAGLGRASKSPQEHVDKLQAYEPEFFDQLKPIYDRAEANAVDDHRKLTVSAFRDAVDVADTLWDRARTSQQIEVAGKRMDLDILDNALVKKLEENGKRKIKGLGEAGAVTDAQKRSIKWAATKGLVRRGEWFAMEIEGGVRGIVTKTLVEMVQQGTYDYSDAKRGIIKQLQEMLERINKLTENSPREVSAPELGVNGYTFGQGAQNATSEILAAIAHSGTQSSLDRLLGDAKRQWGTRPEPGAPVDSQPWFGFVQRMVDEGIITREMIDLIVGYWGINEAIKPKIQETAKKVTGFFFEELEPRPFTLTIGGEEVSFAGGYAPAKYDRYASESAARIEDATERNTATDRGLINLTPSFIKERATVFADTIDLDLRQTLLSFDAALKWAHIAPAVKDVHTVLTRTEFGKQLEEFYPGSIDSIINPMLSRAVTQKLVQRNAPFDRAMRAIRQMVGMNALTFNVPNAVQNYLGTIPVAKAIGARWSAYGWANADWEFAKESSGLMRTRFDKTQQEMAEEMTELVQHPSKIRKIGATARRYGYLFPAITQKHMDVSAWTGAYHKSMNDRPVGMSDEDAHREAASYADHIVRTALGSTDVVDAAAYEGAYGEFGRLFTQFSSWFNNLGEQQRNAWVRTVGKMGYRGVPAFFWEWFQVVYGQLIAGAAITMVLRGQYDEDDDDGLEGEAMQLMLLEPLQGAASAAVPVVGQSAASFLSSFIFEDSRSYAGRDRLLQAPAITALERTAAGMKSIVGAAAGESDLDSRALRTVLDIMSLWSGAPVGAVSGQLGYLADLLSGKVEPRGAVDAARGVIVGSAAQGTRQR